MKMNGKREIIIPIVSIVSVLNLHCQSNNTAKDVVKPELEFLDEYIIPSGIIFSNTVVGGLSSIDYYEGNFYSICDDEDLPRFYQLEIDLTGKTIHNVDILNVTKFTDSGNNLYPKNIFDPEAMRIDKQSGIVYWTSEGRIKKNIAARLVTSEISGLEIWKKELENWKPAPEGQKKWGPRNNKTLEGIDLSPSGKDIWTAMEMPLKQDGKKPKFTSGKYPVHFSQFDKKSGELIAEYAYELDSIARSKVEQDGKALNGLSEIMCLTDSTFMVMERSFVSGYSDGGYNVKIYLASFNSATNIMTHSSLKESAYTPMTKELILDFETIRTKLTNNIIDNVEGICFGPNLDGNNKSILIITDNNFEKHGPQMTQLMLFKLTTGE